MVRCGKCRFCYQLKNESWCDYIKDYVRDDSSCEHGEFLEDYSEPQTNYDRIISKTPEELAKWIAGAVLNLTGGSLEMATEAWLDWLKQEAKMK